MYLAVDIGGTKTLIALFSSRGRVLKRVKFRTSKNQKIFLDELVGYLSGFTKFKIRQIVVAIPGIVQKNYSVKFGNRDWDKIDIYTPVKKLFGKPVFFENDANLAALFESFRLPGRTVFLTFSTGIGGGVCEKNRILPISSKLEPGHKVYTYNGVSKEWEDIASAHALECDYHIDRATSLRKREHLEDVARRVALGLPDIIKEYKPDTIVLGGPMGKIFKLYSKYLPKDLGVKLRRPKRPNESVVYGCYIYAKQKERE